MSGKGTANEKNGDQPTAKDEKTPTSFGVGIKQATTSDVLKSQTPTTMSQATGGPSNTPTDRSTTVDTGAQNFNATAARAATEHANTLTTEAKASMDAAIKVFGVPFTASTAPLLRRPDSSLPRSPGFSNLVADTNLADDTNAAPKPDLREVGLGETTASKLGGSTVAKLGVSPSINPNRSIAGKYGGGNAAKFSVDTDSSGDTNAPRSVNGTENPRSNFFSNHADNSAGQQNAANTMTAAPFSFKFPLLQPAKEVRVAESETVEYGGSIVTVHVGHDNDKKSFAVYESILCARSAYCRDQAAQSTVEPRVISLVDHHSDVFNLYLQLIYTGYIPTKAVIPDKDNDFEFKSLCNLYILSHDLQDLTSQNLIIDALHDKSSEVSALKNNLQKTCLPSRADIEKVFLRTSGQCGARRLLVDLYASKALCHWMREEEKLFPHEFVSELAISLLDRRPMAGKRAVQDVCVYYDKAVREGGEE